MNVQSRNRTFIPSRARAPFGGDIPLNGGIRLNGEGFSETENPLSKAVSPRGRCSLNGERSHTTEIKLRAERKGGELLALTRERGERAGSGGSLRKESQPATLSDLGISRDQSSDWQAVASLPERICLGLPGRPCGQVATELRCEPCRLAFERERAASRPAIERAVYGSAAYRKLRREVLDAAGWRCFNCGRRATTTHHLLSVRQRPDMGLVRDNLRAACRSCQERLKRPAPARQVGMFEVIATVRKAKTTRMKGGSAP